MAFWLRFGSSAIVSIALAVAKHYFHAQTPSLLGILSGMRGRLLLQTSISVKITEMVDFEGAVTVRLPGAPPGNPKNARNAKNAKNAKNAETEKVVVVVEEEEEVEESRVTDFEGSSVQVECSDLPSPVTVRRKKKSSVAPAVLLTQRLLQRRRKMEEEEEDEEDGRENLPIVIQKWASNNEQASTNLDESLKRRNVLSELMTTRPKII